MAAAFIAFEAIQHKHTASTKQSDPYMKCSWYPSIRKFYNSKAGILRDEYQVMNLLKSYLNTVRNCDPSMSSQYFQEIILMIYFLEKTSDYYYASIVISNAITSMKTIRKSSDAALQDKFDRLVLLMLKKLRDTDTMDKIMMDYFIEKDQLDVLLDALKTDPSHHSYQVAQAVLRLIIETSDTPTERVEEQLQHYASYKSIRLWLMKYYETTQQYEKNIQMLENYQYNEARINEDLTQENLSLFTTYSRCGQIQKRDALFEEMKKNRKIKKSDLFSALKKSMSEEEWKHSGKQQVIEWAKGKNRDNCLNLYRSIDAPDLFYFELLNSYSLQDLRDHYQFLQAYDPCILFDMYKSFLKHELTSSFVYHPEAVCNDFLYYYPNNRKSIAALKEIIIELKDDFQDDIHIIKALDLMEDRIYEKK